MTTLSALRSSVRALRRKLIFELTLVRLRRLVEEIRLNGMWPSPTANPCQSPNPLSKGWAPPASGSPPLRQPTGTWTSAAAATLNSTATNSSASLSLGPAVTPISGSSRRQYSRRNHPNQTNQGFQDSRLYGNVRIRLKRGVPAMPSSLHRP